MECHFSLVDANNSNVRCRVSVSVNVERSELLTYYCIGYSSSYSPAGMVDIPGVPGSAAMARQLHPLSASPETDQAGVRVPANACTKALVELLCAPVDAVLHAGGRRLRPLLSLPRTAANQESRAQAAAAYRGCIMRALSQFWD